MLPVTRLAPLTSVLTASVLLAGCGQLGDASSGNGRQAVAAFYPLAWVTEAVAGDDWTVTNLTQPGQEAHDLNLDIAQSAALEDADLVVISEGFQPAVDAAAQHTEAPVLDAAAVIDLLPADHDHDHEHEHEHEGDDHDHDHAHDHGDADPHFWLDPLRMADLADEVASSLSEVDPEGTETYADNAAALREQLVALDQEYVTGLASCERTTTVVSHQAFGYLERYGVHFESIAGLSPDAEATAADLAHLQELITEDGITTVFAERLVSAKMAEVLSQDVGIETGVLDPLEGLSDETAEEDYLSLMRENLSALQQANGCE